MSHIPSAAMPHAVPTHHDEPTPAAKPVSNSGDGLGGWPLAAMIGGVLALGAVAVAVPLLRTPNAPLHKRAKPKGKRKPRG